MDKKEDSPSTGDNESCDSGRAALQTEAVGVVEVGTAHEDIPRAAAVEVHVDLHHVVGVVEARHDGLAPTCTAVDGQRSAGDGSIGQSDEERKAMGYSKKRRANR